MLVLPCAVRQVLYERHAPSAGTQSSNSELLPSRHAQQAPVYVVPGHSWYGTAPTPNVVALDYTGPSRRAPGAGIASLSQAQLLSRLSGPSPNPGQGANKALVCPYSVRIQEIKVDEHTGYRLDDVVLDASMYAGFTVPWSSGQRGSSRGCAITGAIGRCRNSRCVNGHDSLSACTVAAVRATSFRHFGCLVCVLQLWAPRPNVSGAIWTAYLSRYICCSSQLTSRPLLACRLTCWSDRPSRIAEMYLIAVHLM